MMGMAAALLYNLVQMTTKYLQYPVSVKLRVDHEPQLTFPAVTVCNLNPVRRSAWLAARHYVAKKRRKKRAAGRLIVVVIFIVMLSSHHVCSLSRGLVNGWCEGSINLALNKFDAFFIIKFNLVLSCTQ